MIAGRTTHWVIQFKQSLFHRLTREQSPLGAQQAGNAGRSTQPNHLLSDPSSVSAIKYTIQVHLLLNRERDCLAAVILSNGPQRLQAEIHDLYSVSEKIYLPLSVQRLLLDTDLNPETEYFCSCSYVLLCKIQKSRDKQKRYSMQAPKQILDTGQGKCSCKEHCYISWIETILGDNDPCHNSVEILRVSNWQSHMFWDFVGVKTAIMPTSFHFSINWSNWLNERDVSFTGKFSDEYIVCYRHGDWHASTV